MTNKIFNSTEHFESTQTLDTIFAHRSIRDFKDTPVSEDILELCLHAGQAASNYSHTMVTSVVRITDKEIRKRLAEIAHQSYVESAPEFLVFCVDFTRIKEINPDACLDSTDTFVTAAIDVGVFAQNTLLAAESLGLGGIYIGAIRHQLAEVDSLLELPQYVVPLFGLCLGHCNTPSSVRPRLPLSAILKTNKFSATSEEDTNTFNEAMIEFSEITTGQSRDWNSRIPFIFKEALNPEALAYYQSKGFFLDCERLK